jgi:hypothetical protein
MGTPQVSEAKWAKIKRSFNSEDLKCDLRADIVSFDHWEEYLESRVVRIIDGADPVEDALALLRSLQRDFDFWVVKKVQAKGYTWHGPGKLVVWGLVFPMSRYAYPYGMRMRWSLVPVQSSAALDGVRAESGA